MNRPINSDGSGNISPLENNSIVWVRTSEGFLKRVKVYEVYYRGGILKATFMELND